MPGLRVPVTDRVHLANGTQRSRRSALSGVGFRNGSDRALEQSPCCSPFPSVHADHLPKGGLGDQPEPTLPRPEPAERFASPMPPCRPAATGSASSVIRTPTASRSAAGSLDRRYCPRGAARGFDGGRNRLRNRPLGCADHRTGDGHGAEGSVAPVRLRLVHARDRLVDHGLQTGSTRVLVGAPSLWPSQACARKSSLSRILG